MREEWVLVYFVTGYDIELLQLVEELDFLQPTHQFLFRVIVTFITHFKSLPTPEVVLEGFKEVSKNRLTPGEVQQAVTFFTEWANCDWNEGNRKYVEAEILKWTKRRRAQRLIQRASRFIAEGRVDSIPALLKHLSTVEKSQGVIDLRDAPESRIKTWSSLRQRKGVQTPFALGSFTSVYPKEVALIIAPPKLGKSFLLNWVGAHAIVASKARVMHFTLEMPALEVAMRYDLNFVNQYGQVNPKVTEATYLDNSQLVKRYLDYFLQEPAQLKLIDIPSNQATFSVLEARYDQVCDTVGHNFDLVLIDYANLIKSENVKDRSKLYSVGTDVFEWLHDFAKEKNVAVWTIARTTRDAMKSQEANALKRGMKERVRGSQVGHSYAIIYDCDHIVTMSDLTEFEDVQERKSRIFDISLDYSRRCSSFYGFQVEIHYPTVVFYHPPVSKVSRALTAKRYPESKGKVI